jgi:hypothetical protein
MSKDQIRDVVQECLSRFPFVGWSVVEPKVFTSHTPGIDYLVLLTYAYRLSTALSIVGVVWFAERLHGLTSAPVLE